MIRAVPVYVSCVSSRWKNDDGGRKVDRDGQGGRMRGEKGRRVHSRMKKVKQKGAEFWVRRDTDTETETSFLFLFFFPFVKLFTYIFALDFRCVTRFIL
jgi:hypothetical protein